MWAFDATVTARHTVAVLARDLDVAVIDISRSGCLIESPCELDVGTLCVLRVAAGGKSYTDTARIAWCHAIQGAGDRFHLGAEFVWLDAADPSSLRWFANRVHERQHLD